MMKSLRQLYAEHQGKVSDKWSLYLDEYDRLFSPYRQLPVRLLEIGVQNGGSLEVWSKFFTQFRALIGCDINPDCSRLTYDDPRIHVVVGDANAKRSAEQILALAPSFDLVIDDGSHRSSDIIKSFLLYFPRLEDGGLFVAEDLHCSYWDEFEGGLFDPYSSIAFFKRLADVINSEHWGVQRDPASVLDGIFERYRCEVEPEELGALLASVHSVEFINSICVVRKRPALQNVLGPRIIAGDLELVVPDHRRLQGSQSVASDQNRNPWTTRQAPPDEAYEPEIGALREEISRLSDQREKFTGNIAHLESKLVDMRRALSQRDTELARLHAAAQQHSNEIGAYHQAVMEREAVIEKMRRSTSWRLTAPLRRLSDSAPRLRYRVAGVRGLVARDGAGALMRKAWRVYRRDGLAALRQRASRSLFSYNAAHNPLETTALHPLAHYLPVHSTELAPTPQVSVDVIIPVYRGLDETRNCIESVLAARCTTRARIVVIDDCSPEPEVSAYLQALPQSPGFVVLRNDQNLGFVGTVNRGMRLDQDSDVVLLNSDTEVSDGWLDRLAWHAYSAEKIASVTPFSNNATICSYPRLQGTRKLPNGVSLASLNRAFWEANAGRSVSLPTAIGFCMYIRRACLDEIGLFDEEAFGKGYGEENDFCLRAISEGWDHLLAADAFVFHAGEVSFQDTSSPGKARAMEILRTRYPHYETSVAEHVQRGEAEPMRIAATAARYRLSGLPVVLMIGHHLGGGTEKHMLELCERLQAQARCLVLMPKKDHEGVVILQAAEPDDGLHLELPLRDHVQFLVDLLKSFAVSRVHVHHLVGMPDSIHDVVAGLGVPFDFTVHDYYAICPQINLAIDGRYCGEPDAGGCNQCIAKRPSFGARDIVWWRQKHAWLLDDAERVICPSHDVATRVSRYRPAARALVASHEVVTQAPLAIPELRPGEPLRIVLLGWLAKHKGAQLVADCVALARKRGTKDIRFHLIGRSLDDIAPSDIYTESGEYDDSDIGRLIAEADPHLIWLASTWPETYSYTLSAALAAGRAVVAPNLGAFPERVSARPWSWVVPWNRSGAEFLAFFEQVRENFERRSEPPLPDHGSAPPEGFYDDGYFIAQKSVEPALIDLRRPGLKAALAVVEILGDRPSPCAYIRVLLPLAATGSVVRIVRPTEVSRYIADVVYCHRIAVHGADVNMLIEHCRRHDMRLIYDLDDDLLAIAESAHPERQYYAAYAPSIRLLVAQADEVRVSTPVLKQRLEGLSDHVSLVPNALDADTWSLHVSCPDREAGEPVGILYMGTLTHGADFALVKGALRRVKETFGRAVSIHVIGVTSEREDTDWCNFVEVPPHAGSSYPAFVEWLVGQRTFDIGIAPLTDSEFNKGKSGIKFLDYAALGLAVICSDVDAYRGTVKDGSTGLLVANDEEAWYAAIQRLVTDVNLRNRLARAAREELAASHTLQSHVGGAPFRWSPER